MKFANKSFEWYWQSMCWPFFLLVAWSVAGLLISFISFDYYIDIFTNKLLTYAVPISLFMIAGYVAYENKATPKQSAWSGALAGILSAVVGIIITVIMIKYTPLMDWTVGQAVAKTAATGQAVDPEMLKSMMKISMTIGMVFSPVFNGLFGALFGWLGHVVGKPLEKMI